jgi:AcrR family transcriptional regulator
MKDIVAGSGAPIGSLYHHFPRGKVQIAGEALVNAGRAYALLIPTLVNPHTDLGEAVESVFAQAAQDMAATGFANMCPVGTVAAEIADTVEELRVASAGVMAEWLEAGEAYFASRGVADARDLTATLIATLEGAFVLARTLRDTEPLLAAGRVLGPRYRGIPLLPSPAGVSLPAPVGTAR